MKTLDEKLKLVWERDHKLNHRNNTPKNLAIVALNIGAETERDDIKEKIKEKYKDLSLNNDEFMGWLMSEIDNW